MAHTSRLHIGFKVNAMISMKLRRRKKTQLNMEINQSIFGVITEILSDFRSEMLDNINWSNEVHELNHYLDCSKNHCRVNQREPWQHSLNDPKGKYQLFIISFLPFFLHFCFLGVLWDVINKIIHHDDLSPFVAIIHCCEHFLQDFRRDSDQILSSFLKKTNIHSQNKNLII